MKDSNILIVDDAKEVLSSLKREFKEEPYKVFLASSSEEAIEVLEKHYCKLIISDVKMTKMGGLELLDLVHQKYPDMMRFVLSGHSDVKLILDIVNEKGIDRYFTKPWNIAVLKSAVQNALSLYDLLQKVRDGSSDAG